MFHDAQDHERIIEESTIRDVNNIGNGKEKYNGGYKVDYNASDKKRPMETSNQPDDLYNIKDLISDHVDFD